MGFNLFRLGVLIRIGLLLLVLLLFTYLIQQPGRHLMAALIGVAVLLQAIELFRFTEVTNKKLTRFLESIRYSDFSTGFTHDNRLGKSFRELNRAFTSVLDAFRQARSEKEEHLNYLNTVVQHVTTGLLSFDEEGKIGIINPTARRFLDVDAINNIRELASANGMLYKTLRSLKPGDKTLFRVNYDVHLAVHATELRLKGHVYTLVALQNIHSELQSREIEAWQNLTRVLRHEIMNSITPIASLTGTLNEILNEDLQKADEDHFKISVESLNDLEEGLQTIENRSKGLVKFVDAYRDYTSVPKPRFAEVHLEDLFDHLCQLLKSEFKAEGITFGTRMEHPDMRVMADRELIEMVLINIIKNAKEAVLGREDPRIEMIARYDNGQHVMVDIKDNGPGIIPEALERIFIPFYTTKKNGSGIGLALSQQIMQMHRGSLTVRSEPEIFTIFTLRF
jgi:two-component system, NtrC family, nitrogen regulation sensor histidine kinase NtrY